jgi:hypothetical protein
MKYLALVGTLLLASPQRIFQRERNSTLLHSPSHQQIIFKNKTKTVFSGALL